MPLPRIDEERFLELVRRAPVIAFQEVEFGFAVAAPGEAYYAPVSHPGGSNLPNGFAVQLGTAFVSRISKPGLRTLRPTAKPVPTAALVNYLRSAFGDSPEPMTNYDKAVGDHPAVIESETQVVEQAIEEHGRPDLKAVMTDLKRDFMSDALDLLIEHAGSARELCEVGKEYQKARIKLYLLQASAALQSALSMLLEP
jgi:hypothetical protein